METDQNRSCKPKTEIERELQFLGPAGHSFGSLEEQCNYYLDTFCPNWKNYQKPESYIIPPMFKYQWQLVSDEDFEKYREQLAPSCSKENRDDKLINDRLSEEAEHIVFTSICQAIQESTQPPFIAIHKFDFNQYRLNLLKGIYPNVGWPQFHQQLKEIFNDPRRGDTFEYDFLIVGEKIGVVVIEVKSSSFDGSKCFNNGKPHLPEGYEKGLNQLKSIDAFLEILEQCTQVKRPNSSIVSKILFTPNLKRERYEEWTQSLKHDERKTIDEKYITDILQLFKEDVEIKKNNSKSISMHLKNFFAFFALLANGHAGSKLQVGFETYGKMLAGIAAMAKLKVSATGYASEISMEEIYFSQSLVTQQTARTILQQPHERKELKIDKGYHKASQLQQPKNVRCVIFWTPEQIQVMDGGNQQIIEGAAGTGKTMLLQQKALELLAKGEKVIIIAPKLFGIKYKQLFDENLSVVNQKNYQICSWQEFDEQIHSEARVRQCSKKLWNKITKQFELFRCDLGNSCTKYVIEAPENVLRHIMKKAGYCNDSYKDTKQLQQYIGMKILEEACTIQKTKKNHCPMYKSVEYSLVFATVERFIKANSDLCNRIQSMIIKHHILIDDAMADASSSDMICLTLLAILAVQFPQTINGDERTVWITYDPLQFFHESVMAYNVELLWSALSFCISFSCVKLDRVMRCSVEIFSYIQNTTRRRYKGLFLEPPQMGHKIQGVKVKQIFKPFFTAKQAWEAIECELPDLVASLLNENIKANNFIGIILCESLTDGNILDIVKILQATCPGHKVATISNYQRDQDVSVVLGRWRDVYSFEWPIVIHVWCALSSLQHMTQYVAQSRAIAAFIEFSYLYDIDDKPLNNIVGERFSELPCVKRHLTEKKFFPTANEAWRNLKDHLIQDMKNMFADHRPPVPKGPTIGVVTDGTFGKHKGEEIVRHLNSEFRKYKSAEISKYHEENDCSIFVGDFHDVLSYKWLYLFYVNCERLVYDPSDEIIDHRIRSTLAGSRTAVMMSTLDFKYNTENETTTTNDSEEGPSWSDISSFVSRMSRIQKS